MKILTYIGIFLLLIQTTEPVFAGDRVADGWSVGDITQPSKSYYAPLPLKSRTGGYAPLPSNKYSLSPMSSGRFRLDRLDLGGLGSSSSNTIHKEPNLQPSINRETKSQEARAANEYRAQMRESRRDWSE